MNVAGEMCEYNLFAVCNHYGSLKCGHYTADVKCHRSNTWFTYSDSRWAFMRCYLWGRYFRFPVKAHNLLQRDIIRTRPL